MNIAEILKECPRGMKLYCTLYGEVELKYVRKNSHYPIVCVTAKGNIEFFTSHGRFSLDYPDEECVLFPSKDQRDWSKFIVPDTEPAPKHQFKPFDKVLVRDLDSERWRCDFFEKQEENEGFNVRCFRGVWYQCIPYEGNEHLLGTTNNPEE